MAGWSQVLERMCVTSKGVRFCLAGGEQVRISKHSVGWAASAPGGDETTEKLFQEWVLGPVVKTLDSHIRMSGLIPSYSS